MMTHEKPDTTMPDAAQISALRDPFGQLAEVEVVAETGSTNADLMARLPQLQRAHLLIAHHQTAGRGRAGRNWHSSAGNMLTFSLAWPMHKPAHALLGLPLAIGVAIAEVLHAQDIKVSLKWPNDILRDGAKLAGILVESAASAQGCWIVVGVGLNLIVSDALEQQLGRQLADAPWLARMDRNALYALLLNGLARALDQFDREGFGAFQARWNALHAYAGMPVQIMEGTQVLQRGEALGVDLNGCLVLQTENGQQSIMAGDVSLRPATV